MPKSAHLRLLKKGKDIWNKWREQHPEIAIDLSETDLSGADLNGYDLSHVNFQNTKLINAKMYYSNLSFSNLYGAIAIDGNFFGANLSESNLSESNFSFAKLYGVNLLRAKLTGANFKHSKMGNAFCFESKLYNADFSEANLTESDFSFADLNQAIVNNSILINARFHRADLSNADFSNSNLTGADLSNSILVETNFDNAILNKCYVYGISAWSVKGNPKQQNNLLITPSKQIKVTVDDLQTAQLIHLFISREKIRNFFNSINSKAVLILGRFTEERKEILNGLADELKLNNLVPIIFDFENTSSRDFTETIKSLVSLSFFVIADITSPQSQPLELQATVPDFKIPFILLIKEGETPFSMINDLAGKYKWIISPIIEYSSIEKLRLKFKEMILKKVWEKHKEIQIDKIQAVKTQSVDDFVK